MQPQSHERFALGLTTPSLTANEDEHKQVMEETIAAFDNKLVKAQKDPSAKNNEANNGGSIKAAAVVPPMSSPELIISKGPSSRQQNYPAKVHHVQARQTLPPPLQQGMGIFRLKDGREQKPGRKRQQNKDNSKATTDTTSGMKNLDARKASAIRQPIVCQPRSIGSALSPNAVKQPYSENLTALRSPLGSVTDRSPSTPKNVQLGCEAFQQAFIAHLETRNTFSLQSAPERRSPRRNSNHSGPDSHTMATDESMLSPGRSPTPFSEPSSSSPPSYVHLSDLERSKSHHLVIPRGQIATWSERLARQQTYVAIHNDKMDLDDSDGLPSSFEDYLNADWDHTTVVSKSTDTDFATSQSGIMSLDGNISKAALLDPKWVDTADRMEI